MSLNKSKLAVAVAAAAGLTFSVGANATNGIIQAGNGMVAHGLGGAGLSNAGEASAGMDNPALISQTGDAINVAWSIFMPDREIEQPAATGGALVVSDSTQFAIPQAAFTSKINNDMSWGIMAYAMGGMNTNYRTNVFGAGVPEGVNLQGLIIAPTLSYAFSKNFSAGASLLIGQASMTGRNLFSAYGLPNGTFEDSAMGYGVKLGVDYKITDGISVGAMVQPQMQMDEFKGFKTFLNNFGYTGDASIPLPNEFGIGAKFAAGKSMDIVADVLYYQWSGNDVFDFFGWEDQIVYKIGLEFRPSEAWALRVGFNYAESPIKGDNQTAPIPAFGGATANAAYANYLFPAITETHITFGLSYKMDKNLTVSGYYLYAPEATQTDSTGTPALGQPPGAEIRMTQNAFGLGVNYAVK
jgi:long-chain fatty acid transport protein